MRILKILSRSNPLEAVYLGVDNLYLMNGNVRLCDPFLNRTRLLQELIKIVKEMEFFETNEIPPGDEDA